MFETWKKHHFDHFRHSLDSEISAISSENTFKKRSFYVILGQFRSFQPFQIISAMQSMMKNPFLSNFRSFQVNLDHLRSFQVIFWSFWVEITFQIDCRLWIVWKVCFSVVQGFFFEGRRPKIGPFNSVSVLKLIQPSKKEKKRFRSFGVVWDRFRSFGSF